MKRTLFASATLLAAATSPLRAAEPALAYAPADAEFVISVNLRQVADSSLFRQAVIEKGEQQVRAQVDLLKRITSVDVTKDIDRVYVWGRVNDDESAVILAQGRYERETLLSLLRMNATFKEIEVGDQKVYQWIDDKERSDKYGAFLPDGSVLLANSRDGVEKALTASEKSSGFLKTPSAQAIPPASESLAAWIVVSRPGRPAGETKIKTTLQADAANATLSLAPDSFTVTSTVTANSVDNARLWNDMARGAVALLQLQDDDERVQKLARTAKTRLDEKGRTTTVELTIPNQDFINLARGKR